jgi:two-component system cell cycle response regulator
MQSAEKSKQPRKRPKRFKVGLVGASETQRATLLRIFTVTQYRTRSYEAIPLPADRPAMKSAVDFVLMCSPDSEIITTWTRHADSNESSPRPLILLSPPNARVRSKYQLSSPVNPGKLIKMLDSFTIRELNFFPEFEIGSDNAKLDVAAVKGLNALRASRGRGPREAANPLRAMVVDDSLTVRRQMKIEFDLFGDHVDMFDSAEAALMAARKQAYDIIFLDVVMPGMDGYTACKLIKRCGFNRNTPVVMLTSRSSSFDKIKGTLAGCNAYLVKPISHNEFETVYRKHTRNLPTR